MVSDIPKLVSLLRYSDGGAGCKLCLHGSSDCHCRVFGKGFVRSRFSIGSLKNCAKPLLIEAQREAVLPRKVRNFLFSVYFVDRPQALQLILVDRAMTAFGGFALQLAYDPLRKLFHRQSAWREVRD